MGTHHCGEEILGADRIVTLLVQRNATKNLIQKARAEDEKVKLNDILSEGVIGNKKWCQVLRGNDHNFCKENPILQMKIKDNVVTGENDISKGIAEFWEEIAREDNMEENRQELQFYI